MRVLVRIHRSGIAHGDIDERNVLFNADGKPFVVDFEEAVPHTCGQAIRITLHHLTPDAEEFGCDELHTVCIRLGIWTERL